MKKYIVNFEVKRLLILENLYVILLISGRGGDTGANPGTEHRAGGVHPPEDHESDGRPGVCQLHQLCRVGTGEEHACWWNPEAVS